MVNVCQTILLFLASTPQTIENPPKIPTFTPQSINSGNHFLTGPMISSSQTPTQKFNPTLPPSQPLAQTPLGGNTFQQPPSQSPYMSPISHGAVPNSSFQQTPYYAPSAGSVNTNLYTPSQTGQPSQSESVPYQTTSQSPTEYNISPFASLSAQQGANASYIPATPKVTPHWFYLKKWTITMPFYKVMSEWIPFSKLDSNKLEHEHLLHRGKGNVAVVPTDGGRYDVNLSEMNRKPVYWNEEACAVRRCTWFYKEENQFVPYEPEQAEKLEVCRNHLIFQEFQ